jgi:hypothetical protein
MNRFTMAFLACVGAATAANAAPLSLKITADNHYALYSSTSNVFSYHGGNEIGAGGLPGTYNWSLPETYNINVGDRVFIAAWSDDSVAQGLLAEVWDSNENQLHTGVGPWEVYKTGMNRGNGDPHPTTLEIAGHVQTADLNSLWEVPFVGAANGVGPWGVVPGIDTSAKWIWWNNPADSDPLRGGDGAGEMLIFSYRIPTPGSLALGGMGALLLARRRRGQ